MEWDGSSLGGSVYSGGPLPHMPPHMAMPHGGVGGGGGAGGKTKKRARPGGPYYDDYEMMQMMHGGFADGKRKKKPQLKGFECEGCGQIIGTLSNLERHRTKSCPVLVKGQPR